MTLPLGHRFNPDVRGGYWEDPHGPDWRNLTEVKVCG